MYCCCCCPGVLVVGYRGVTGGEAAGLYAECVEFTAGYPPWFNGVEESGAGMLFLRPPAARTGEEPEGSMDMRSIKSLRRCCSWSAPCDFFCSMFWRSWPPSDRLLFTKVSTFFCRLETVSFISE